MACAITAVCGSGRMTAIRKLLLDQQLGMLLRLGCRLLPRGRLVVIFARVNAPEMSDCGREVSSRLRRVLFSSI